MKNYYKILEVNENASYEVIEKAYRVLAKKYHPDIQPKDKIYWAENKFKEITEAYEVLSNPESKRIYDIKLGTNNSIEQKYDDLYSNQQQLKQEINNMKINKDSQKYYNKSYIKRYTSTIKELIYNETKKPPEERSKDFKALILTIIIVSILVFIFWKVPFLNNFLFP